jgi:threonine dehydratase
MMRQVQALGANFDLVLAPVSGGGLLAGVSEVVKTLSGETEVWGVEPARFDDLRQSLEVGERVAIKPSGRSLCDALESPAPGEITFPMLKKNLAGAVDVTDREVTDAMRYAFSTLKLVVEPGGSAGLAALLAGKIPIQGKTVGLVLSGGNVDPDLFARVIRSEI